MIGNFIQQQYITLRFTEHAKTGNWRFQFSSQHVLKNKFHPLTEHKHRKSWKIGPLGSHNHFFLQRWKSKLQHYPYWWIKTPNELFQYNPYGYYYIPNTLDDESIMLIYLDRTEKEEPGLKFLHPEPHGNH